MKYLSLLLPILCFLFPVEAMAWELPRTGQRTCYDQEGNIIDHTSTGQDGDLQSGAVWPDPRFTDNGDGTISDHLTGLMWLLDGNCLGAMSWQAAVNSAAALNSSPKGRVCDTLKAQYDDWFLPDINQLESLYNYEEANGNEWLESWGFSNIKPEAYWSATTSPNPYIAWLLRFDTGEVTNGGKVERANVLLARRERAAAESPPPEADTKSDETELRFQDNGDGTVTDTLTDLMWLKDAACTGDVQWQAALNAIRDFNEEPAFFRCRELRAQYDDWTLPNRNELRSLIDSEMDLPALAAGHPFLDVQPYYWSSTSGSHHPEKAYDLFVGSGEAGLSGKAEKRYVWPVRLASGRVLRERVTDKTQEPVYQKNHYILRPKGEKIVVSWPPKRFKDLGNGTLLDNVTGLMWLKDSDCLGKKTWQRSFDHIELLNRSRLRMKCEEYKESYEDWRLPDLVTFSELVESFTDEPAAWLNLHGALGVRARDYWSVTENVMNLYYAWAINLAQGTPRNYSKTFLLNVWPVRTPQWSGPVAAVPVISGNDTVERLELHQGKKLLVAVAVSSVSRPVKADLKIYYTDPEGTAWWLAEDGQWTLEESVLYHGNLFEMESDPVFYGSTTGMAVGQYTFHFDIETASDIEDASPGFSSTFSLTLLEAEEADTEEILSSGR